MICFHFVCVAEQAVEKNNLTFWNLRQPNPDVTPLHSIISLSSNYIRDTYLKFMHVIPCLKDKQGS